MFYNGFIYRGVSLQTGSNWSDEIKLNVIIIEICQYVITTNKSCGNVLLFSNNIFSFTLELKSKLCEHELNTIPAEKQLLFIPKIEDLEDFFILDNKYRYKL